METEKHIYMRKNNAEEFLAHIDSLHTTPLGEERIRKNLGLEAGVNPVEFCKREIISDKCTMVKEGKNWYCSNHEIRITVNSFSYTIITAKRGKVKHEDSDDTRTKS